MGAVEDYLEKCIHTKVDIEAALADNNGHLSACFCVMRRKQRRFLDLSMRVTVYNPLTASSCWRTGAVLTELKHDAVILLPGTQKRVAVDAPPYQLRKFNGAWGLSWGFRRGAYESNRSAGVSLLFFVSLVRVCARHPP